MKTELLKIDYSNTNGVLEIYFSSPVDSRWFNIFANKKLGNFSNITNKNFYELLNESGLIIGAQKEVPKFSYDSDKGIIEANVKKWIETTNMFYHNS